MSTKATSVIFEPSPVWPQGPTHLSARTTEDTTILVNDDKLLKKMVVSATTLGKTSQTNYASLLRSGPDTASQQLRCNGYRLSRWVAHVLGPGAPSLHAAFLTLLVRRRLPPTITGSYTSAQYHLLSGLSSSPDHMLPETKTEEKLPSLLGSQHLSIIKMSKNFCTNYIV